MHRKLLKVFLRSCSANPKSTACPGPRSGIQNRKWLGLSIIAFVLGPYGAVATAQQPAKIPRIGYVSSLGRPNNPGPLGEAFRQGLRDLGHVEGKTILIEARYVEGRLDRIPSLVAELVELKVDVLVSTTAPAIRAAK